MGLEEKGKKERERERQRTVWLGKCSYEVC